VQSARNDGKHPYRSVLRMLSVVAFCLLIGLTASARPAAAVISNVDEADDICAASEDPCVLTDVAQVVNGAVLDFGTRVVEIKGNGRLDAGTGNFSLLSGGLRLLTGPSTAINMKGSGQTGTSGGVASITTRRRCAGDESVICAGELDCAVADAGVCTVGDGGILVAGRMSGSADSPALFLIRAAGDVEVVEQIQAAGSSTDADGGTISIESAGSITIGGALVASSGSQGAGGDISLIADRDVTITRVTNVNGGGFDGGYIEIDAGRDVMISEDVSAGATASGGFGGEISVTAGRDITISGGTSFNRLTLDTTGSSSVDNFGGDGGAQSYIAERDIRMTPFVLARTNGAPPDGYGEEIYIDAGRNVLLEADLEVKARGLFGAAGYVNVVARAGNLFTSSTVKVDMTGKEGGGEATFQAFKTLTFDGFIDATAGSTELPGRADFISDIGDILVSGDVTITGGTYPGVEEFVSFTGCGVKFTSGSAIVNRATGGINSVTASDRIQVLSGASITSQSGSNRFTYRSAGLPPIVSGTVTPSPVLSVDASLVACPVCGNGISEIGETCDDGNKNSGDGCSPTCQDEGCVADTPDWPNVLLCDDGKSCTSDACDTETHSCTHTLACSDGGGCTTDQCGESAGRCLHLPDDSLCDDEVFCTRDVCGAGGRCSHPADHSVCDDGHDCTSDLCHPKNDCEYVVNHAVCEDDSVCTLDQCVIGEGCTYEPVEDVCDDGLACTVDDVCVDGTCVGDVICAEGEFCVPSGICSETTTTIPVTTTSTTSTTTTTTSTTTLPSSCGNGIVEAGEDCDAGPVEWAPGQSCRDCSLLLCGDPDGNGTRTAGDALFVLRAAVQAVTCDCVCDVDASTTVTAGDALRLLRVAVGTELVLDCPCS
jgi:cysteine-rich repeat protein